MTSTETAGTAPIGSVRPAGQPTMSVRHVLVNTSEIGMVIVVASGSSITGLYFPGHWTRPDSALWGVEVSLGSDPLLVETARQLHEYLRGERTSFDVPTQAAGTAFEELVWALLAAIPFGGTKTYGELAEQLGDKSLARIVGQAVGHNPLSILVGCHRVVGSSRKLTGYAGGLERKEFLLTLEGHTVRHGRSGPELVPTVSPGAGSVRGTAEAVTLF